MNAPERAIAYRIALSGRGRPGEVALARICADLPSHLDDCAEAAWEGALLAGVLPGHLRAVVATGNWPAVAALADLAGEDPSSRVVRFNRERWSEWSPPEPETT